MNMAWHALNVTSLSSPHLSDIKRIATCVLYVLLNLAAGLP